MWRGSCFYSLSRFMPQLRLETAELSGAGEAKAAPGHGRLCNPFFFLSPIAVKSTLLVYQSPTTGLFPTKTCGGDPKAKIQDSLYCAAAAWALALAYR